MLPLTITDKALREVKAIMKNKNIPEEYGLRIGIKGGGGCGSGMSYMLGFDKKKPTDDCFEIGGIMVYIEKKHVMYLVGLEMDYYSGADTQGFNFHNPETQPG